MVPWGEIEKGPGRAPQAALVVVLIPKSRGGVSQRSIYYCAAQFTHTSCILFLHHVIHSIFLKKKTAKNEPKIKDNKRIKRENEHVIRVLQRLLF